MSEHGLAASTTTWSELRYSLVRQHQCPWLAGEIHIFKAQPVTWSKLWHHLVAVGLRKDSLAGTLPEPM